MIEPVPWVELTVFWVVEVQDGFLGWEDFDAEVAGFTEHDALLGDFVVWPAEHFDDGTFLTVFEAARLVD